MEGYLIFLIVAFVTVLSPGPGVVLTITNALRFGISGAIPGILGIACSTFIVATATATGLAVILATSTVAFTIIKYIGAAYLLYLGYKLWRAPGLDLEAGNVTSKSRNRRFMEGLILQLTNPKAVFFFISVFPQFIDHQAGFTKQFMTLVSTYSLLVIAIHIGYAYVARTARLWFSSGSNGRAVNRIGGTFFVAFGCGLATASK